MEGGCDHVTCQRGYPTKISLPEQQCRTSGEQIPLKNAPDDKTWISADLIVIHVLTSHTGLLGPSTLQQSDPPVAEQSDTHNNDVWSKSLCSHEATTSTKSLAERLEWIRRSGGMLIGLMINFHRRLTLEDCALTGLRAGIDAGWECRRPTFRMDLVMFRCFAMILGMSASL
jgi:hypothetical protein